MAIKAILWLDDFVADLEEICRSLCGRKVVRVVIVPKESNMADVVLGGPDFPFEVQGFNQFDIQVPISDATVAFDAPTIASDKVDGDGKNGSLHALAVGTGNITARAAGVDAAPFPIAVVQDTVVKTVRIVPGAGGGGPTP